jgi:hypothetical protein
MADKKASDRHALSLFGHIDGSRPMSPGKALRASMIGDDLRVLKASLDRGRAGDASAG